MIIASYNYCYWTISIIVKENITANWQNRLIAHHPGNISNFDATYNTIITNYTVHSVSYNR